MRACQKPKLQSVTTNSTEKTMSDLAITAANVLKGTGAQLGYGTAGAAITAGQALYIDTADSNKLKLADADGASALRTCVGLALNNVATGQPVTYQKAGELSLGSVLTQGKVYVLSDTAGGIMPVEDLEAGDYVCILGVAKSSSVLSMSIFNSGIAG